ncbi:MAG: hypothetical protein K2K72_05985 [Duncaniella sp.]|nr:hypothetical protein [Duncaniella sp.]
MKLQSLRHIFSGLAAVALLAGSMMVTGCADSHEVVEDLGKPKVYNVEFRFKAGNNDASRATEEFGTVEECYVPVDNLKILLFDENKRLKQVLYDNGVMDKETSFVHIGLGDYVLRTKLDPDKYDLNSRFAVVALANWRCLEGDTKMSSDWNGHAIDATEVGSLTIDDLASMTFELNPVS